MALQAFFRWPCYRSKICPGDEPGEQMASTEDPRKRKIILLLAGIEPGSPSCESDVLPLDHGLPLQLYNRLRPSKKKRNRKKRKSNRTFQLEIEIEHKTS